MIINLPNGSIYDSELMWYNQSDEATEWAMSIIRDDNNTYFHDQTLETSGDKQRLRKEYGDIII